MLGRRLVRETESGIKRRALDVAQLAHTIAHRPEQLMQPRKRQTCLRLHTSRGQHRHTPLTRDSLAHGQQTRLADPGLATNHERLASRGNVVQERRHQALFLEATDQGHGLAMSRPDHLSLILPHPKSSF